MDKYIRKLPLNVVSIFDYPLIINSYGRSGSTVLTKSVIESAIGTKNEFFRRIVRKSVNQNTWDLTESNLKGGIVYKTHDYPPKTDFKSKTRMLYTFAHPVDVVLSLIRLYEIRGEAWMKDHYNHLNSKYDNFFEITEYDQLNLQKHLNSWLNENRIPIAFIKYESMWDHQEEISNFLGFPIELPPFKKRKANNLKDLKISEKISKNYEDLVNQIDNLDSFFINLSS